MELELWKKIPGYEEYEASTLGRIRNKKGLILKQSVNKRRDEYKLIRLYGIQKYYKVHRLIANTFIPNPENKPFVNHINGIKSDNRIENLEWVTPKENAVHAIKNGLMKYDNHKKLKINEQQLIEIKEMINDNISYRDISKKYNISIGMISLIKNNKRRIYG